MTGLPFILRLNKSGMPLDWVTLEDAVCMMVKDHVIWTLGDIAHVMRGGFDRDGHQTEFHVPAIIATDGELFFKRFVPSLENSMLFRRDQDMCLYCGKTFGRRELTRDHVIPRAQGGRDIWSNVVSACRRCNHRKGPRTPEQASMPLLAVPFEPNQFEFMVFANRRILSDQMEFLKSGFSKNCRLQ